MGEVQLDNGVLAFHQPAALESSGALIYTIDRDFQVTMVHPADDPRAELSKQILGGAAVGTYLLDWPPEPLRSETEVLCQAIFAGKLPRYERELHVSAKGERHSVHLVVTPLHDDSQHIVGAVFNHTNITTQRTLERETWEQHQQLQKLVDDLQRLQEVAAELTADTELSHTLNVIAQALAQALPEAAVALLIRSEDELHPMEVAVPHPLNFQVLTAVLEPIWRELRIDPAREIPLEIHVPFPAANDRPHQALHLCLEPIRGRHGTLLGAWVWSWSKSKQLSATHVHLLGAYAAHTALAIENADVYNREVTARRSIEELEREAANRNSQLLATIAAMCDAVVLCDAAGQIVLIDHEARSLFGEDTLLVGQSLAEAEARLQLPEPFQQLGLDQALQGEMFRGECAAETGKGERTLEICAVPVIVPDNSIQGAVAVIRDVTEERLVARFKDDFVSVAAHELKTPITTLKGYAQLALKRLDKNTELDATRRMLETIDAQAERITRLVGELLDVTRIQSRRLELNLSRFDLVPVVRETLAEFVATYPDRTFQLLGDTTALVDADLLRIDQVLRNVLGNAIKFSPEGSRIDITVHGRPLVEVMISDHGVGVSGAKLPYIFEPWYQAHYGTLYDRGGMGLGLYIAKEIIEQHGGSIKATSQEEEGTTIRFTLPAAPTSEWHADVE